MRRGSAWLRLGRLMAVGAVAWSACAAGVTGAAVPAGAADEVSAVTVLTSLPVASEARSGYSRAAFRHWTTVPSTSCDTREVVLIDERKAGVAHGCYVAGGMWLSAYDGVTTRNPSSFDIDHLVPLAEAWDSGAWRWTPATREAYANDLGYAGSLIAVTASSNRSKGDQDPAEWLPSRNRCGYAKQWIAVKSRWRLAVDATEKSALGRILAACPPMMTLPPRAAVTTDSTASRPDTSLDSSTASGSSGSNSSGASASGSSGDRLDPRFRTCGDANDHGYGPYVSGKDAEYDWYIDRDRDGVVCEP